MDKELYICDYPYTLYSAIIKTLDSKEIKDDLIITNSIEGMAKLYEPIKSSNIFKNVYFYNDIIFIEKISNLLPNVAVIFNNKEISIKNKISKIINIIKILLKAKKEASSMKLPVDLNEHSYSKIYYSDRIGSIMFYLNENDIKYTALEHGKNVWSLKNKTSTFFIKILYLLEKIKLFTGINAYTKACNEILVYNEKNISVSTPKKAKVTVWNIDDSIDKLTLKEKDEIYNIYSKAYNLTFDYRKKYNLLLTTPLYSDGRVGSEEFQIKFYKDYIEKEFENVNLPLIIKAHPRDKTEYQKYFPDGIVIDKSISAEVLSFSKNLKLDTAFTWYSTSIFSFKDKANKIATLTTDINSNENIKLFKPYN